MGKIEIDLRQPGKFICFAILAGLASLNVACSQDKSAAEYLASGQSYMQTGEWKSAIIEFKNVLKQEPDNAEARALLGKAYVETRSANAAIKELNRAIELGYDAGRLSIPLGLAYRQAGEHRELLDKVEPAAAQSPAEQAMLHALRATAYMGLGDGEAARTELERARELDGEGTEIRLAWAAYESALGNAEAQERWLQPLLERDGGVADAWSQMSEIEQRRRNPDAAEKALTRAIEIRQEPHYDYVRRALARVELGNIEGAESDIDYLRQAGANWPMLGYAEGMIDFRAQNHADALVHFQQVLAEAPEYPPAQLMAGLSHYHQRNYQSSITHLEQYLDSVPDNPNARTVLAASLLASGKVQESMAILEELEGRDPENFRVLSLLSEAYFRQGRNVESQNILRRAVRLQPDQAGIRLQLGSSLIRNPETAAQGQEELLKALELNPELRQAKLGLFQSYLREKKFDRALEVARSLEAADPDQSFGANLEAMVLLAQGKVEQSVAKLEQTLEKFPADVLTSHNLARLHIGNNALDDARTVYLGIIEVQPENMLALQQLAYISAREGNTGDMMQWLQKNVDRNPDETRPKLLLASQLLQQRDANAAIQVLNNVDVEDKADVDYVVLMSKAKIDIGELDHAFRLLSSLTRRRPELPVGHYMLAQVYAAQNRPGKLREALQQTIRLAPDHLMAQVILARLDLAEDKDRAFEARLKYLQNAYPENVQVKMLEARRSSQDKNYQDAIEALSRLMAESPEPDVAIELARNQWRAGDRQGAISGLELWTQNHEDNRVMLLLAEYYLLEDRADDASRVYEAIEARLPSNPTVLNNLAWSLKDSNPEQGLEYARKADTLSPGNPYILDTLALLLHKTGDDERALQSASQAAEKAPEVVDIQLNYADILVANGRKNEAIMVYKDLLRKTSDQERKSQIAERLENLEP